MSNILGFFWLVFLVILVELVGWSAGRPSIRRRLEGGLLNTLELGLWWSYPFFWLKKAEFGRQLWQLRKVFVLAVILLCRMPE